MKTCLHPLFFLFLLTRALAKDIPQEDKEPQTFLENHANAEKGKYYLALAKTYLEGQDLEKAFTSYLCALEYAPTYIAPEMKEEETILYEKGLEIYLKEGISDPTGAAFRLVEHIEETALSHPNYFHLHMLLATAYANMAKYALFFDTFYHSYPYLREDFLAYKIFSALHFRLMQMSREEEEKEKNRALGISYLLKAREKNVHDPSLYKKLIVLAKERKDNQFLLSYLEKMVECEVGVARGDILFYVQEALKLQREDIARKIIEIAKKEYAYSRSCLAAEEYLKEWKK